MRGRRQPGPTGLVTAGRADPAELPVATIRGGDDLLGRARLRADVLADRDLALDDPVAEAAEPLDPMVIVGAVVIFAGTYYSLSRERR